MDSSPHSVSSTSETLQTNLAAPHEERHEKEEPHIHLPNPSYWPILISICIGLAMASFLFVDSVPWLPFVWMILVLACAIGWGREDSMAPLKEKFVTVVQRVDTGKFKLGQPVVDSQGKWLGRIESRFVRYILVEQGGFLPKVFYVPRGAIKDAGKGTALSLTLSEDDLVRMGLNRVPDDLYDETPEPGIPVVKGAAQFARRPLSPAETGHYNYGKNWPGMNTDAGGSYHPEEILPTPQTYVTEAPYVTDRPLPPREIGAD